ALGEHGAQGGGHAEAREGVVGQVRSSDGADGRCPALRACHSPAGAARLMTSVITSPAAGARRTGLLHPLYGTKPLITPSRQRTSPRTRSWGSFRWSVAGHPDAACRQRRGSGSLGPACGDAL